MNEHVRRDSDANEVSAVPGTSYQNDPRHAYLEWLRMEARLLQMELYPSVDQTKEFSPVNTFAKAFHFPSDKSWQAVPAPSTRASLVLNVVGVDFPLADEKCMIPGIGSRGIEDPESGMRVTFDRKTIYTLGLFVVNFDGFTIHRNGRREGIADLATIKQAWLVPADQMESCETTH